MSRQFTLPSSVSQVSLPSTGTFSFQILITNLQFSFSKGQLQRSYKAIYLLPHLNDAERDGVYNRVFPEIRHL